MRRRPSLADHHTLMASATEQPPPSFWQSQQGQRMLYQGIAAFVLLLLAIYFVSRALTLDLSIDFMGQKSGFSIANQWLTTVDSQDSRWAIYGAGVFNTIRLVIVGIILATLLGVVMGVARLSNNWLVSRLAAVYVEAIRNTPLLVQIIFWHTAVLLRLPRISDNVNIGGVAFLAQWLAAGLRDWGALFLGLVALVVGGAGLAVTLQLLGPQTAQLLPQLWPLLVILGGLMLLLRALVGRRS